MATYETHGSITDWVTHFAPAGRVAACATDVAGNPFSAHLDDKARNCCTDGKHICDVVQGNLCADQTTFSPAALTKNGITTCIARQLVYERLSWAPSVGKFSWACIDCSSAAEYYGYYSFKRHLDQETAACCTSGGNVCTPTAPTTTAAPTTACPTPAPIGSAGTACNEAAWPDLDHGLICGECKVLVNHFSSKYTTCDGACFC
jgi:hypothetical protein